MARLLKKFQVARKNPILFCFDYDGTLVRLRRDPDRVFPSKRILKFLNETLCRSDRRIAVISGRALKDLKKRLPLKGVILAGSHGRETNDPDLKIKAKNASVGSAVIFKKLKKEFLKFQGVHFEIKPHSFVVHYRRAAEKAQQCVERWFLTHQKDLKKAGVHLLRAKKAFEVAAFSADKGQIIEKLKKKYPKWKMVIAGDDETDRAMFRAASKGDLTIAVGGLRGARVAVKGTTELLLILKKINSKN